MSLTRNDVKKALASYDEETKSKYDWFKWIPIVGKLFLDPIEIQELKYFITRTENSTNLNEPLEEAEYLELVLKLIDISWNVTLTGLSDDLYRCFNSNDLLNKAMGEYGKDKIATLNILKCDGLANKENVLRVSKCSIFGNAIPSELNQIRKKSRFLEQEDVNDIFKKHSSPRF